MSNSKLKITQKNEILVMVPMIIVGHEIYPEWFYHVVSEFHLLVYYAVFGLMTCICVNRYMALVHLKKYSAICTNTLANRMILACLVGAVINFALQYVSDCYAMFSLYFNTVICYQPVNSPRSLIFLSFMQMYSMGAVLAISIIYLIAYFRYRCQNLQLSRAQKKENSIVIQFAMISSCVVLFTISYFVMPFIVSKRTTEFFAQFLAILNSAMNPFCYMIFCGKMKQRMKMVIMGGKCNQSVITSKESEEQIGMSETATSKMNVGLET